MSELEGITGITCDSRKVEADFLYAALPGTKAHGADFLEQALERGAMAVLSDHALDVPEGVRFIHHDNPRKRYAQLAASFYKDQPKHIVGVTGTNGKSSTVHFVRQFWNMMGYRAASMGTLGLHGAGIAVEGAMTTPDPADLHAALAKAAQAGITHLAMEASSHGLHQHRLAGVRMMGAGFTNLSRDHLDYHGDMAGYRSAKELLFKEALTPGGVAVINADDPVADTMIQAAESRGQAIISYGEKGLDIRLLSLTPHTDGQDILLEVEGHQHLLSLPLIGKFQCYNVMCALGLVMAEAPTDIDFSETLAGLVPQLKGVPGRLERIDGHPEGAAIFVDYAHTPDALKNVLMAVRPHTEGRVIAVLGCGGDRDAGKRPLMGEAAHNLADIQIITDDNPRSEDPAAIRAEILATCAGGVDIGDRRAAIKHALDMAEQGDVILIAGKGHESGQTINGKTVPFDDRDVTRALMNTM